MKDKTIKELKADIQALNTLLLEQRDHINALTTERDNLKSVIHLFTKSMEMEANEKQRKRRLEIYGTQ